MKRYAMLCGLTAVDPDKNDGWDGACPGADVDVMTMQRALLERGFDGVCALTNSMVTADMVDDAFAYVNSLVEPGDLLLLYYTGHGGQVPDESGDESDALDETLCLWDGELVDDIVGTHLSIIVHDARVLVITDCCHSETNIRGKRFKRMTMKPSRSLRANVIHFAGCSDDSYSYGDETGGTFTNALISSLSSRKQTYFQWFNKTKKAMPQYQKPAMTEIGDTFGNDLALK